MKNTDATVFVSGSMDDNFSPFLLLIFGIICIMLFMIIRCMSLLQTAEVKAFFMPYLLFVSCFVFLLSFLAAKVGKRHHSLDEQLFVCSLKFNRD